MQTPLTRKRITSTPKRPTQVFSLVKYLGASVLLIGVITALKGALAWTAERFIYTLPMVGGLLKSLELMEVSNVVVFAILGVGLGAFTLWLPKQWPLLIKAIPLAIGVPLVFLSSYIVRYHVWIQQVAVTSELLPAQAAQVTNNLLLEATGHEGLRGFFEYTVQVPILPTDLSALQAVDRDDKWFRSELTRYSGVEPGIFSRVFRFTGWGIRLFYTLLAVITAIIYFTKGLVWANTHRKQPRGR
ncbi:MAG: hypothetical protein AAGE59_25590 [Cyanobacteria bacterium P01_F01_bin.86]